MKGIKIKDLAPSFKEVIGDKARGTYGFTFKVDKGSMQVRRIVGRFQKAINVASIRIAMDLSKALDEAMMSDGWEGGDIVDTGRLMESGNVIVNGDGITVANDSPYAAIIHYGGYVVPYGEINSRVYLPPRPWIEAVMLGNGPVPRFDIGRYYYEEIAREFNVSK